VSPTTATLDALDGRVRELWRPPPRLSLASWADAKFMLPAGDANAGRWHTIPYQRGILDAMSDPALERVTWMKSARVGFTKSFCAAVGYYIEHDPCPILLVQPTEADAKKHSKEDIAPMFRDVPALRGLVSDAKTRDSDNTILEKLFTGGSLSLIGANSPRGFRRTSRRVVIFDEVDGYPPSAGTEGDPIELGIRRTEYYANRKIIAGSTPTVAGRSRIEVLFQQGDQRRYYVPCPSCGVFQVLRMPNMKWPEGKPERAYFACAVNGCVIEHRSKRDMVEAGQWRAEAPEHFTEYNRHASFHIWAGYSYSPNATWGQLAAEFVKAVHGGPVTLKTFVNTALGEPFQERGEAPDWERIFRRRETYALGTMPAGALFLTAGVDVQKDRLVYEVVGWGRGKTSWSIDVGVLAGDTADLTGGPWPQLDALLARTYPHAYGTEQSIARLAIDAGYNTQQVYGWARKYPMSRVIAVKGQTFGNSLVGAPSAVEMTDRGRKLKRGYKSWPVTGHIAKTELYGWLRLEVPTDGSAAPPGFCHFPQHDESFFRELTSEQLIARNTRSGFQRLQWELIPGRRNEALDARIYARAAAAVYGLDRFSESDWRALEKAVGQTTPTPVSVPPPTISARDVPPVTAPVTPKPIQAPAPRTPWLGDRRRGWLKR
jgi:phage terminase large subunit GpA-like protein